MNMIKRQSEREMAFSYKHVVLFGRLSLFVLEDKVANESTSR